MTNAAPAGRRRAERWWRPLRLGLIVLGVLWAAAVVYVRTRDGFAWDARTYWLTGQSADVYATAAHTDHAYLYSPAFAQVIAPLTALPWQPFLELWTALQAAALVVLAGPLSLPLLLTEPVLFELDVANVTFLLGLAIVAGFRWPAAWAFVLLTKVTPGVGVLWFAFRREWRSLGIALGVTAAIVAVSFALAPAPWMEWIAVLLHHDPTPGITDVPLLIRLPVAVALLGWGARGDRRWIVPVVALLAMPVIRTTGLCLLVACIPLATRKGSPLSRWIASPLSKINRYAFGRH